MQQLFILNFWTNLILLNLLLFRGVILLIRKKQKLNYKNSEVSIGCFLIILISDFWLFENIDSQGTLYYSATASIFLPLVLSDKFQIRTQLLIVLILTCMVMMLNSEVLTQLLYIATVLILVANAKLYLLGSSLRRYLGLIFGLIALNYFFILQPYTLSRLNGNWSDSHYLVYFSIGDYIVSGTTLIVIHANFKRLFFS